MVLDCTKRRIIRPERLKRYLSGLTEQSRASVVNLGLQFQADPGLVSIEALMSWANWAVLHLVCLVGSARTNHAVVAAAARDYAADVRLLRRAAARRAAAGRFCVQLREESYFTHPQQGQKRWWVDARVCLEETGARHAWKSKEIRVGQACLTRGFPASEDYSAGAALEPHYAGAWDCRLYPGSTACHLEECDAKCVKCRFVDALISDLLAEHVEVFEEISDYVKALSAIQSCTNFKIIK